jgi:lysophospholipase L1-like esterase
MKTLRDASKLVKKSRKISKSPHNLMLCLIALPVVIFTTTIVALLVFPAGALSQNSQPVISEPETTADTQDVIAKVNRPLNAPEAEPQAIAIQIVEQKRLKEEEKRKEQEEKRRLEQEKILALEAALKIKQARDDARNKICFIGDSITEGGVYGERGAAERAIDILNAGHPADDPPYDGINIGRGRSTTANWVAAVASDVENCRKPNIRMIMIMLGTNDAGLGVPSATYLSNMAHIRAVASGLSGDVGVFVNCPILLGSDEGQALIEEYCAGLGANGVTTPLKLELSDGIHPTSGGYDSLAGAWAAIIKNWVGV